jgi:hypothetical protein
MRRCSDGKLEPASTFAAANFALLSAPAAAAAIGPVRRSNSRNV